MNLFLLLTENTIFQIQRFRKSVILKYPLFQTRPTHGRSPYRWHPFGKTSTSIGDQPNETIQRERTYFPTSGVLIIGIYGNFRPCNKIASHLLGGFCLFFVVFPVVRKFRIINPSFGSARALPRDPWAIIHTLAPFAATISAVGAQLRANNRAKTDFNYHNFWSRLLRERYGTASGDKRNTFAKRDPFLLDGKCVRICNICARCVVEVCF